MKNLFIFLIVFIYSMSFSNHVLASMVGKWYVQGSVATKINAKGYKTQTIKELIPLQW